MDQQALRNELAQILTEVLAEPQPVELVLATGEIFTQEAMNLARLYDRVTNDHKSTLESVAELIRAADKSGESR